MPDWEDIRFFVALARHGSLSAAARSLQVNHATVSRRVAALERTIGAQLFERSLTGYELTGDGQSVLAAAAEMENAAQSLPHLAGGTPISGLVRITATPSLCESFLIPELAPLHAAYPALDIEVLGDRRMLSLTRHEADIALRMARPGDSELIGQKVATVRFGVYAAPPVAAAFAVESNARFIGFDEAGAQLPEAVWLRRQVPGLRLAFRSNGHMAQAAAARAGIGVAVLPHYICAGDAGLVQVHLSAEPPERELWMLTRRDSQRMARLQVVKEFLVERFRESRAAFAGPA
jgi:DNA-binding transcriptional LysR family regulator